MTNIAGNLKLQKMKAYVKENWGSPLVAGFIILLFSAAIFSAAGWIPVAEAVANCAYFALATGVVLQLVSFSKNRRKNEGA